MKLLRNSFLEKFCLIFISIFLPIIFFQFFDFFYSRNTPNYNPFKLRDPINNGKSLYISNSFGWYDLGPNYNGESRYGGKYFFVKTDENGFRINHLIDEENNKKSNLGKQVFFIGDSFTFGVGVDWRESFIGILNKTFNIKSINAGVNSHSPTLYKFKLKRLIEEGLISNNQKIVIGLDISDVYDEATRWTEYNGMPANINKLSELSKNNLAVNFTNLKLSEKHGSGELRNIYNKDNFKLTYQIYYGLESFVKIFIDDIQVRNNDRSKFTHQDWELIEEKFLPLGVENGLKKIRNNLIEIAQIATKNKNELYLLIYPWPAQMSYESSFDWQKYVKNICIEINCSGVIDTFPYFLAYKENSKSWQKELFIRGDMHFNQKGNYILAEIIANELNKNNFD